MTRPQTDKEEYLSGDGENEESQKWKGKEQKTYVCVNKAITSYVFIYESENHNCMEAYFLPCIKLSDFYLVIMRYKLQIKVSITLFGKKTRKVFEKIYLNLLYVEYKCILSYKIWDKNTCIEANLWKLNTNTH